MAEDAARGHAARLEARLREEYPGLLESYPVASAASLLDGLPRSASYSAVPEASRRAAEEITSRFDVGAVPLYNELLLTELARAAPARAREKGVPPSVTAPTMDFLSRMVAGLVQGRGGSFSWGDDRFAKDLSVARLKLLVCGPELVDPEGGVPRRCVLERPLRAIPGRALFMLTHVGGLKPLLESHLDRRLAREFSPQGYEAMYLRLADLMDTYPRIRGFVGAGAWFCDPAVAVLSPELAFVTQLPLAHGARLLPTATTEASIRDAVRTSPTRRAAYEAGAYQPRSYMLIWPRRALLRWARETGREGTAAS